MNGKLNRNFISYRLGEVATALRDGTTEVHIDNLASALVDFLSHARKIANADLADVALMVVSDPEFTDKKIQAIKRVREMTGTALKEAKDAVEAATVVHLRMEAEKALERLAAANERTPVAFRTYVPSNNHEGALKFW